MGLEGFHRQTLLFQCIETAIGISQDGLAMTRPFLWLPYHIQPYQYLIISKFTPFKEGFHWQIMKQRISQEGLARPYRGQIVAPISLLPSHTSPTPFVWTCQRAWNQNTIRLRVWNVMGLYSTPGSVVPSCSCCSSITKNSPLLTSVMVSTCVLVLICVNPYGSVLV